MNKLFSILILGFAFFLTLKWINDYDQNKEISRSVLSKYASKFGRHDIIKNQLSLLKNEHLRKKLNTYLLLAYKNINDEKSFDENLKNISDNYDNKMFEDEIFILELSKKSVVGLHDYSRLKSMNGIPEQAHAYAIFADIQKRNGNNSAYKNMMKSAFENISKISPLIAEDKIFEIIEIAKKNHDTENYLNFLNLLYYSPEKIFAIYDALDTPPIIKEYPKFYSLSKEIKIPMQYAVYVSKDWNHNDFDLLEKRLPYSALHFNMSWKVKKWKTCNNPIYAYILGKMKLNDGFEFYKKKSLDPENLNTVKGDYINYVIYSAVAFANLGHWQDALSLIDTIKDDKKKNDALKQTIKSISKNKNSLDALNDILKH